MPVISDDLIGDGCPISIMTLLKRTLAAALQDGDFRRRGKLLVLVRRDVL